MNMLMLTAPVTRLSAGDMIFSDRLSYAGELTLIGMVTIFAVLALLWGSISIMRVLLNGREETRAKKKASSVSESPRQEHEAPVSAPAPAPMPTGNDDAALLAAITAAIAVVWESEHPGTGFRVVSYRHVDKRSAWNMK